MTADKDRLSNDDISTLYQRGSDELPPAHLDDAIRAAARREVCSTAKSLSPFAGNWKVPLSLAALLVISSSLVILIETQQQGITTGEDIVLDNNRSINEDRVVPGKPRAADPLPAETRQDSQEREGASRQQFTEGARPAVPASKPVAKMKRREDVDRGSLDLTGIRGLTAADTAAEPGADRADTLVRSRPTTDSSVSIDKDTVMNFASTPPAIPASASQDAVADVEQYAFDTPEQWLKAIDELLKQKNTRQAKNSLEAFTRKYPQYQLTARYRRILASQ
ncbi:MAG: hypothetical protein BMS9Abin26_0044 [Gammaproteobacteria bacterium]|nr:MAG: hypothetical protein BMS9Abin26_0044 [Gammaproteobacteria bacterium]